MLDMCDKSGLWLASIGDDGGDSFWYEVSYTIMMGVGKNRIEDV